MVVIRRNFFIKKRQKDIKKQSAGSPDSELQESG